MTNEEPRRRWLFKVTDWDDEESYLDADGKAGSDDDLPEFVGTYTEAAREGECRADRWENREGTLAATITLESRGMVR